MQRLRPEAPHLRAVGRGTEALVHRLRGGGGKRGGAPDGQAADVRGLRPEARQLRAAGRGADAMVRRLRGAEGNGAVDLSHANRT